MILDIDPHITGDTWIGINSLTLTYGNSALNLTNAFIEFSVKTAFEVASPVVLSLTTNNNGIEILNASSGIIKIPERIVDIPVGNYQYYITVTQANSSVKTPYTGNWKIIPRLPITYVYDHYPIIE
jgi:hypothetical protein